MSEPLKKVEAVAKTPTAEPKEADHVPTKPTEVPKARGDTRGLTSPRSRAVKSRFLTDVLVELEFVTAERAKRAIDEARIAATSPERLLLQEHVITPDQLSRAIAERYGLDHLDLSSFQVDMAAANLVTPAVAKRYGAVPVSFLNDRTLLVALADPSNVMAADDIRLATGFATRLAVASSDDISSLISRLNRFESAFAAAVEEDAGPGALEVIDLRESADDAPVIKLVHSVIADATERGASDIHFEPQPDKGRGGSSDLRVRLRIDGVMTEAAAVPRRMAGGVISRIKIMADLDIAERRLPQDGRVGLTIEGRHVDLRVVTIPSVHGESVVLRILDQDSIRLELDHLGMQEADIQRFRRSFRRSHGAILATGPTGSGKSTSLYGALLELNTEEKNIITIEDPVEYQIPGITQMQVNLKAGLTFDSGLRSMMRADPDILMVGEIRDRTTAQIAIEGALTGHLVLSTLHTNDAPSAISRLVEMGIEPFLLASAIECVVGQRLVRTLCPNCKERTIIEAEILRDNGFKAQFDIEAYNPVGCVRCGGMGYKGRTGVYEVMVMSERLRSLALTRASGDELMAVAVEEGMRQMRDDGLDKVKAGITSLAEVARVTGSG
jgi:type IV pilus assembly protein PilB